MPKTQHQSFTPKIQILAFSMALITSCSNSEFGGGEAQSKKQDTVEKNGKGDNTGTDTNSKNPADTPPKNPNDGDDDKDAGDPIDDLAGIDDPALRNLLECLRKKPTNYNVVMVLDNSNSQVKSDPNKVRRAVSMDFVKRFNTLVSRKRETIVNVSVVAFSGQVVSSGWTKLDGRDEDATPSEPIDSVRTTIIKSTEGETIGTRFKPAFDAASDLFKNLGEARLAANTKNIVLFMTDGEPTDPGAYSVESIKNTVVIPHKAAIISIASGSKITNDGIAKVQALALPTTGEHQGAYHRAATPEAMKDTWDKIFKDLGGCK